MSWLSNEPAARSVGEVWRASKPYRVILIIVLVYTALRLIAQGLFLSGALGSEQITTDQGVAVPVDMQVYLTAADNFRHARDLYLQGPLQQVEFFQYTPVFAAGFIPFLWLPAGWLIAVHSVLHVAAYIFFYLRWGRLFDRLGLTRATRMLAWTLPLWLIYPSFWADWAYLNIYVVAAVVGTLLLEAVLDENLPRSILWLTILLPIKPHWAFAAGAPLLLGRWRFFTRLALGGLIGYVGVAALVAVVAGPAYVLGQYGAYVQFLANLAGNFPWRGAESGFPGYNHSIMQTVVYWLGSSAASMQLATGLKVLLSLPLGLAWLRHLAQPGGQMGKTAREAPLTALAWAFALYLLAFLWLDWVWELSLGMPLVVYLLATESRKTAGWILAIFLPFGLLDFWQLVSVAAFGDAAVAGAYILTDPSIYVPMTLIVILVFYGLLVRRLWQVPVLITQKAAVQL